jgi:hypothetical protein
MLRILGQLASTVALLFAAAALIGTTYLAGYLGGFGVSLTTIRLDPGTAVITALVPVIYLAPALLVGFGYVFSVAVGLAAQDEEDERAGRRRRGWRRAAPVDQPAPRRARFGARLRGFQQRWFDEPLVEGVGFALVAAAVSVAVLDGTLTLLNLPRTPDVLLLNVIVPATAAVLGIFPAHWIVNSPRFGPHTRVWWATLGIIVWAILAVIVTYVLGAEVARQYTDQLTSPTATLPTRVTIRDTVPGLNPSGAATPLGATTYDNVVLLFRDEQAWLFAVREPTAPRGYHAILVPAIQVIAVTSVE